MSTRLLTFALIAVGCAQPRQSLPVVHQTTAPQTTDPRLAQLEQSFESQRRTSRIPGMSVAIVRNDSVIFAKGFGFMDGEGQRRATAETSYWIASLTKPFTAVTLLKLAERGQLDLDRKMSEVPGYADWCKAFVPSGSIFAKDMDCSAPLTIRQTMSHLVNGVPGERFAYNAAVYSQLRRVAPLVSSKTWRELMIENVLTPVGMKNTAAGWYDAPKSHVLTNLAQPRRLLPERGSTISITPMWEVGAGAGLISTVLDIAAFDIAIDRGRLLSRASMDAMWEPAKTTNGDRVPYGLGWYVEDYAGKRLIWHSGWEPDSYSGLYLKIPQQRLTLIMLANSEGLWWGNALDKAEIEKSPFVASFLEIIAR